VQEKAHNAGPSLLVPRRLHAKPLYGPVL
jgi:hypothetical protein